MTSRSMAFVVMIVATLVGCASTPAVFPEKYRGKSQREMFSALLSVHDRARIATRARFDELFDQFAELLARGKYGARLSLDVYDHTVDPGVAYELRFVTNAEGYEEGRYLEFVTREDAATAAICAEQDWLFAQLAVLPARD